MPLKQTLKQKAVGPHLRWLHGSIGRPLPRFLKRGCFHLALTSLLASAGAQAETPSPGHSESGVLSPQTTNAAAVMKAPQSQVRDLSALLDEIRGIGHVPAVACAVVRSNQWVALGCAGVRKWGDTNSRVTMDDRWHLGSVTKSMTATLAAMLVEHGKIRWETTIPEVFPTEAAGMAPAWRSVTLEQLCSHRSGAPGDLNPNGLWSKLWAFNGTPRESRRLLLQLVTALPPNHPPGSAFEYSNAGFAIAGAMLEQTMDQAWEALLNERLFQPLGMANGGFGAPAAPGRIDQPWGHVFVRGVPSPIAPGPRADNPTAIGPAGIAHCSVVDLARYAQFHLAGEQGDTRLLSHAAFVKLHREIARDGYALGWVVTTRSWARGFALNHTGSNTQWYSNVWLAPGRQFAVVALANIGDANGGTAAFEITDKIAARMIREFLPE